MCRDDMRFYQPETAEEELALVPARVRERRHGLRVMAALFGASALAATAFSFGAHLVGRAAQVLLPAIVILIVMPGVTLAIVGVSSLMWRSRFRRLTEYP